MNNPIAIFRNLRDTYRRYLDSPLAIRYDALRDERRALLFNQDRRLWREPLIEPVQSYPVCGADFADRYMNYLTIYGVVELLAK